MSSRQRGRSDRSAPSGPEESSADRGRRRKIRRWFGEDGEGKSPAKRAFEKLPLTARAGLDLRWARHRDDEARAKDLKNVEGDIWELRYREFNNQYRMVFLAWGHVCVILDAFYKNQEKLTKQELDRFRVRAAQWITEHGKHPPNDGQ